MTTATPLLDPQPSLLITNTCGVVIVKFICQLDWTVTCPDIWLNIILGVPMRMFLDEDNI